MINHTHVNGVVLNIVNNQHIKDSWSFAVYQTIYGFATGAASLENISTVLSSKRIIPGCQDLERLLDGEQWKYSEKEACLKFCNDRKFFKQWRCNQEKQPNITEERKGHIRIYAVVSRTKLAFPEEQ